MTIFNSYVSLPEGSWHGRTRAISKICEPCDPWGTHFAVMGWNKKAVQAVGLSGQTSSDWHAVFEMMMMMMVNDG